MFPEIQRALGGGIKIFPHPSNREASYRNDLFRKKNAYVKRGSLNNKM
jgi:hypothetical protein